MDNVSYLPGEELGGWGIGSQLYTIFLNTFWILNHVNVLPI